MTETLAAPAISEADEQALLDSIDRWLTRKVAPIANRYEQADEYPTELVQDMCEMGLFGALIEPQYGGLGLPATAYSRIVARISEEWMSLTGFFNSHLMMALVVQKTGQRQGAANSVLYGLAARTDLGTVFRAIAGRISASHATANRAPMVIRRTPIVRTGAHPVYQRVMSSRKKRPAVPARAKNERPRVAQ